MLSWKEGEGSNWRERRTLVLALACVCMVEVDVLCKVGVCFLQQQCQAAHSICCQFPLRAMKGAIKTATKQREAREVEGEVERERERESMMREKAEFSCIAVC